MRGFGPALLLMASYTGGPIRYRIVKNEPTPTKIVTPMENKTLASSTCLVSSRRVRIVRIVRLPKQTVVHCQHSATL